MPHGEFTHKYFLASSDPRYKEIGQNRFNVPSSYDHLDQFFHQVFAKNDVVFLEIGLNSDQKETGNWFKSDPIA